MNELKKAKELLMIGDYTCVLVKASVVYSSGERGVAPLLKLIDSGNDYKGFYAADKVVGKAAALLYAYMGIKELYAKIVSDGAIEVLQKYNIICEFEEIVPYIINRSGDGICPMEKAVANTDKPEEALLLIKEKLLRLQDKSVSMPMSTAIISDN